MSILTTSFEIHKIWVWLEWVSASECKLLSRVRFFFDPMDYTVHGILQARILERVAFSFSRGSSQPRDRTQVSCIAGRFFTNWAVREALSLFGLCLIDVFLKKKGDFYLGKKQEQQNYSSVLKQLQVWFLVVRVDFFLIHTWAYSFLCVCVFSFI